MEYPCIVCGKEVRPRQHAVSCDVCSNWQHRICNTGISLTDYKSAVRGHGELNFVCRNCSPMTDDEPKGNVKKQVPFQKRTDAQVTRKSRRRKRKSEKADITLPRNQSHQPKQARDRCMPNKRRSPKPSPSQSQLLPIPRPPTAPHTPAVPARPSLYRPWMDTSFSDVNSCDSPIVPRKLLFNTDDLDDTATSTTGRRRDVPRRSTVNIGAARYDRSFFHDTSLEISDESDTEESPLMYTLIENGTQQEEGLLTDSHGYTYHVQKRTDHVTSWRCMVKTKHWRCTAAVTQKLTRFTAGSRPHRHLPHLHNTGNSGLKMKLPPGHTVRSSIVESRKELRVQQKSGHVNTTKTILTANWVQATTRTIPTPKPRQTPAQPRKTPSNPRQTPAQPRQTPNEPRQSPAQPRQTPAQPRQTPAQPRQTPTQPRQSTFAIQNMVPTSGHVNTTKTLPTASRKQATTTTSKPRQTTSIVQSRVPTIPRKTTSTAQNRVPPVGPRSALAVFLQKMSRRKQQPSPLTLSDGDGKRRHTRLKSTPTASPAVNRLSKMQPNNSLYITALKRNALIESKRRLHQPTPTRRPPKQNVVAPDNGKKTLRAPTRVHHRASVVTPNPVKKTLQKPTKAREASSATNEKLPLEQTLDKAYTRSARSIAEDVLIKTYGDLKNVRPNQIRNMMQLVYRERAKQRKQLLEQRNGKFETAAPTVPSIKHSILQPPRQTPMEINQDSLCGEDEERPF